MHLFLLSMLLFTRFLAGPNTVVTVPVAGVYTDFLAGPHAVVTVPVADIYTEIPREEPIPENAYSADPINSLKRCGQLLFNETFEPKFVIKDNVYLWEQELGFFKITHPRSFYLKSENGKLVPCNDFWIHKDHFVWPNFEIKNNLPAHGRINKKDTVVLALPFYDTQTALFFSAGTRFKACYDEDTCTFTAHYWLPDRPYPPFTQTCIIPEDLIVPQDKKYGCCPFSETRKEFINIIENFIEYARKYGNIVSYTFGGASLTRTTEPDFFMHYNGLTLEYHRTNPQGVPRSGFDCTTLVCRVADMLNMPFWLKNSKTQKIYLDEVKNEIEPGDLLIWDGHVCILDPQKEQVLQEIGYSSGHGCLIALPLNRFFEGIETCQQLLDHYYAKGTLKLLNKQGNVYKEVSDYKICSLESAPHASEKMLSDYEKKH